jgi:hypothetical protein
MRRPFPQHSLDGGTRSSLGSTMKWVGHRELVGLVGLAAIADVQSRLAQFDVED